MNETQPLILPANVEARRVDLDAPRTYHLPRWGQMSDPQRLAFLRSVATQRGRDPRLRQLAFKLVAGIPERDYPRQAAALLKAVQPGGPLMAYINEPGEVLQDPLYTLRVKAGDCDDAALLLSALFEAVRLPWRYVLSGRAFAVTDPPTKPADPRIPWPSGPRMRWVEGTPYPPGRVKWGHIYVTVGWPVFAPKQWAWAEPTIRNAPLGWDVTSHMERTGKSALPELGDGALGDGPVLPIFDPAHNLRELCKELVLLEDHLCHPEKRCGDCIRKHLLKAEALAEEALALDRSGEWRAEVAPIPAYLRSVAGEYVAGSDPVRLVQRVRSLRKRLSPRCFEVGLPQGPVAAPMGDAYANPPALPAVPATTPQLVAVPVAAGSAAAGATQKGLVETVLVSVTTMVLATIAIETLRAKGVIPGGK